MQTAARSKNTPRGGFLNGNIIYRFVGERRKKYVTSSAGELSKSSGQKAGGVKFSPRPLCGLTPFVYGKSVAVVIDYGGIARGKEIAYYLFGDKRFHVMLNKPF